MMSSVYRKSSVLVVVTLGVVAVMAWDPPARSAAANMNYPLRYSLRVRSHPQETDNWCWAASTQMVLEYFGRRLTQSELADLEFQRRDCGRRPVPGPCNKGGVTSTMLDRFGFTYNISQKPLTELEIAQQIAEHRTPLVFGWDWTGGGAHVMVAVGYSKLKNGTFVVEVMDPAPPVLEDKNNPVGGQHTFITYSRWVADQDHKLKDVIYNIRRKR
jgi:ABC-type bacteriocin/lantibiotic exporter with double-glycine peptidase domain